MSAAIFVTCKSDLLLIPQQFTRNDRELSLLGKNFLLALGIGGGQGQLGSTYALSIADIRVLLLYVLTTQRSCPEIGGKVQFRCRQYSVKSSPNKIIPVCLANVKQVKR